MSTPKLSPSAPLESFTNVNGRLENELKYVNSFKCFNGNLKQMNTYFKDEKS